MNGKARGVEQSLATSPLAAAAHIADATFASYQEEAEEIDADVPSLFFVADHRAETAEPYLAGHCPNPRVEAFGGHMTFREYPGKFNALLSAFPATTG